MTYDSREQLARFHAKHALEYPLLQDLDAVHVNAYGIRNAQYRPGDSGYGVPHPGVFFIDGDGVIRAKFAYPGFKQRPAFDAILNAVRTVLE